MSTMIEIDGRSRVTLPGKAGRRYLMHEDADGTVVLEPAVVLSEMELRAMRSSEIQATLAASQRNPQDRRPRPARRNA